MSLHFSQYYIADGALVDFQSLAMHQQELIIENMSTLSGLLNSKKCPLHPDARITVHVSFQDNRLQNTLAVCCPAFQKEIESVVSLNKHPFECLCLS